MGEGYFDYVQSCESSEIKVPFVLSAYQGKCGFGRATCVDEVAVSVLDDDYEGDIIISFPTDGGNPTFIGGDVVAVGSHSFRYRYGDYEATGTYHAMQRRFEIMFKITDVRTGDVILSHGKLKFSYIRRTLRIWTSDCLEGLLCGLCGDLDGDDGNEFKRCDDNEVVIDSTGVAVKRARELTQDAWWRSHEFGESCCNEELDRYLESSDCGGETPAPSPTPPPTECLETAESICLRIWELYDCTEETKCGGDGDVEGPSDEWLVDCVLDVCLNEDCENGIAVDGDDFTFISAMKLGCLDPTIEECKPRTIF